MNEYQANRNSLRKSLSELSHVLLEVIRMGKLSCLLVITVGLFIIALNSFAANGQELNLDKYHNDIIDSTKFITFKDEEGQVKIFKTLASLRFDNGQIRFEIGEFVPTYKKEAKIQHYRAYFEQSRNKE